VRRFALLLAATFALFGFSCVHLPPALQAPDTYWGFAAPWDARSLASIREHAPALSVIVSAWIAFDSTSFRPVELYPDSVRGLEGAATRFALITTYQGNRFHPEILRGLSETPGLLAQYAGAIAALVDSGQYRGVVLDFEGMTVRDLDVLLASVRTIGDSARAHGASTVVVAVPAADTAAYPGALLLSSADYLMPMIYDQHWSGSAPGPIAEPAWALKYVGMRAAEVGAGKIIAAFPVYGYRWRNGAATEVISYYDARSLAELTNTPLTRDPASGTLHALSSQNWEIWVSDAALMDTLVRQSRRVGVKTFAFWRLGLEDPALWQSVKRRR